MKGAVIKQVIGQTDWRIDECYYRKDDQGTFSKQAAFELRKRQISGMCIPEKSDRKYDYLQIWVS